MVKGSAPHRNMVIFHPIAVVSGYFGYVAASQVTNTNHVQPNKTDDKPHNQNN
jgi:hypothetical protein